MEDRIMQYKEIIEEALQLEKPSTLLNQLLDKAWFQEKPFDMLYRLNLTEQSPLHHPEGDVWKHTMLVVNEAAKVKHLSKHPRAFMWAALLHDIGKPATTRNRKGKITAYNHDSVGAPLAVDFLKALGEEEEFIKEVTALVRWHMQIMYVTRNLPFAQVPQMLKEVDPKEISLLGFCDRMGRTGIDEKEQERDIRLFYEMISKVKIHIRSDRKDEG